MAQGDRASQKHRDVPALPTINVNLSVAGGVSTDFEHVIYFTPDLTMFQASGETGDMPINAMNVRLAILSFEAALTGVATNNFTLNFIQRRAGNILVNTTSATTVTGAGTATITPASMANISLNSRLVFSGGTGATETVVVSAVNFTGGTFTATFANNHSGAYTIQSAPLATVTYATTTSATTVVAGVNTVTPASMASIYVGSRLQFSGGTGATEVVLVTSVTATTFTANFANGHSGAYTIAIAELAFVNHQFYVPMGPFNAILPGDVVTLQRISNGTGLANPALTVGLDLVPTGVYQ